MHYISEFLRSKPIAVCMALKLPEADFPPPPGPGKDLKISKNWRRNWIIQTDTAVKTMQVEEKNSSQAHYHALLRELARDLGDIQVRLSHLAGPEPLLEDQLALVQDLQNLGRYDDACQYLGPILDEQALASGDDSLELACSYKMMADMLLASGRYPAARRNARAAKDIYISNLGANDLRVLESELALAEATLKEDALDAVQEIVAGILDRAEAVNPSSRLPEVHALLLLAQVEGLQRHFPAALEVTQNAAALIQEEGVDDPTLLPKCRALEGILYRKMAKWEEAEECFDKARDQLQDLLPDQHIDMGRITLETSRFHMLKEEFDQAEIQLEKARDIFARLPHAQLERLIAATFTARLSRMRGDFKRTKRMVRRGLKFKDKLKAPAAEWEFRLELERVHVMLLDGRNGDAEDAIAALLEGHARVMAPAPRGELYLLLGKAQWQQRKLKAAIASLQQAQRFLQNPLQVAEDLHLRTRVLLDLAELWMEDHEPAKARQAIHNAEGNLALHDFEQALLAGRRALLLGRIAFMDKNHPQAQEHFEQALCHLERRDLPDDNLAASSRLWLGKSLLAAGQIAEAASILQALAEDQGQDFKHLQEEDKIRTFYHLALALVFEDNIDAAFRYSQRAYKRLDKLAGSGLTQKEQYDIYWLMGTLHAKTGRHQSTVKVLHVLLADMNASLPAQSEEKVRVHDQIAEAHSKLGAPVEAEAHWQACLAILLQFHPAASPRVFRVRAKLAAVLERQGKWKLALAENELLYRLAHQDAPEQLQRQYTMAQLHYRLGHLEQSQSLLEPLLQDTEPWPSQDVAPLDVYLLHSRIAADRQRWPEAQTTLQLALSRFSQQGDAAEAHAFLAALLERSGKLPQAIEHWKRALAKFEEHDQTDRIWECLRQLVKLLWQTRKQEESIAFNDKALKLAEAHPKRFKKPRIIRLLLEQGEKYALNDKIKKALACYKKGIDLAEVKKNGKHVSLAAQCLLAIADLLAHKNPKDAKLSYQKVRGLYDRKKIAPDATWALSCMKYGMMLWDRNEMEAALEQMTDAYAVYQRSGDAAVSQNRIMTLQYLILLHADLGHGSQALTLLEDQLRPLVEPLPRKSWPKQLSMETIREQAYLLQTFR